MTSFLKKSISLVTITFLVLQPFLIINSYSVSIIPTAVAQDNSDCQGNPNCTGEYWVDPSANEGNTAESNPDIARAQADREKKDAEAAKKEAENAQKLQEEDKKKCESMLNGGKDQGGTLGKAFKNIFTKAATGLLGSQLPPEFRGIFNNTINTAINDPANLGVAMQESLGSTIIAGTNKAFSQNFERAINQETNGGQLPMTEARLKEIVGEVLSLSTKSALPEATQAAMDQGLAGAIRNTLKTKTPELASGWVEAGVANNFNENGADELRAQIGGPLFSLLSDHARQTQNDSLNLNGADAGDLQKFANTIIEFFVSSIITQLENTTTATAINTVYDEEGNVVSTSTTQRTQGPLNQKVGQEVFDGLSTLFGTNGSPIDSEVEKRIAELPIESLITDSGFASAKRKILSNPETQRVLNGNLEKLHTAIPFNTIANSVNTAGLVSGSGQVNIQKTVEQVMIQFTSSVSSGGGGGSNGNPLIQRAVGDVAGNLSQSVGGFLQNSNGDFAGISESFQSGLSNGLGDMTGNLANGLLDKALGDTPFAGVVDVSFLTDSLSSSVTNLFDGVFNGEGFNIGSAFSDGFANFSSGLAQAALGAVLDLAGIPKPIASIVQGVVDTATAVIIPFVPNREQMGPELTASKKTAAATGGTQENTSQINQTTRSQEQLDVEACTKLRAIDRKQNAEEQKQKVEEPDLARKAATELEKYRQGLLDWVKKGYDSTGQGPDSPLYVENTDQHLTNVKKEAGEVFYDSLKNSPDAFKDQTEATLRKTDQPNTPTSGAYIDKQQYDKFATGRITNTDEWWKTYFAVTDPFHPNSPQNSLSLGQTVKNTVETKAVDQAKEEIQTSNGFLPVRVCEEFTANGQACKRWKTTTPAIEIKDSVTKALATRVDQYLDPKLGAITEGNQPSVEELRNFTPQTSGGGGSGPGTKNSSNILQTILAFLNTLRTQQGNQGSLTLNYSLVNSTGSPSSIKLSWQGSNVLACSVDNDWIGPGLSPNFVSVIKSQGEALDTSGSFTFGAPLTFDLRFSRTRASDTPPEQSIVVVTVNRDPGLYQQKNITLPTDLKSGDILTIRLWPFIDNLSLSVPIGTDTSPATILSNLRQAISNVQSSDENPLQKAEFLKYSFSEPEVARKMITVKPKTTYSISCVDKQGNNIKKSVTIGL